MGLQVRVVLVALLLLMAALLLPRRPVAAHEHAPLKPGQDKDNWWPWEVIISPTSASPSSTPSPTLVPLTPPPSLPVSPSHPPQKLLSGAEMLAAQKDGPTAAWRCLFQAMDSLDPPPSSSPTLLYNVTNQILPALAHLYSVPSMLAITPFPLLPLPSPSRTLRSLSIPLFALQPPLHHHSLALFLPSTSPHADRRLHDRRQLKAVEAAMTGGGRVLMLQRWERGTGRERYWGRVLVPKGWGVERAWGWVREGEGWRVESEWRAGVSAASDDLMTVWQLRVREDVEAGDGEDDGEVEVSSASSQWDEAVAAASPPVTWTPYQRRHRL